MCLLRLAGGLWKGALSYDVLGSLRMTIYISNFFSGRESENESKRGGGAYVISQEQEYSHPR